MGSALAWAAAAGLLMLGCGKPDGSPEAQSGAQGKSDTVQPEGAPCGGLLGLRCAEGHTCHFTKEQQCGAGDQTGVCQPRTLFCTQQLEPVCGCDGKTYSNGCMAAQSGTSVLRDGSCDGDGGQTCGGLIGADCSPNQYCFFGPGKQCGAADQTGVCKPTPEVCTGGADVRVCGCNGREYVSECEAARQGMNVAHPGQCEPQATCDQAGGQCLSDPGDVTFPADCSALGKRQVDASCPAFNQLCCK